MTERIMKMKRMAVFALCLMMLFCLSSCRNDTPAEEEGTATPELAHGEETKENKEYSADIESLKALFCDSVYDDCDADEFEVRWSEELECFIIFYLPPDRPWDETAFVRKEMSNYIDYCTKAYEIDGVNNVLFNISAQMLDRYGEESNEVVMRLWMRKENFEKFNWGSLEYISVYDNFKLDSEMFVVELKNVDTEDVFYVPSGK